MRFPYQDGEPLIIVRLLSSLQKEWIPFVAYVDSGASYSIFHEDVAEVLGIEAEKGNKIQVTVGSGEKIPVFLHKISVQFVGEQFSATIGFSPQLGVEINLIGQKDFFERFRMCFASKHKFLEITSF